MQIRFGELRNGGIRICPDCHEVTLEDEMHLCPGKKEERMNDKSKVEFKDHGGIITDADRFAYMQVIEAAFSVHLDREKMRKGLWKEYPADDQFNQVKVKIDRIIRSLERIDSIQQTEPDSQERTNMVEDLAANIAEEAYDIINYANFGVRQLQQ